MSKIITFRGTVPIGTEKKLHLSTSDGLTGYRINKFQIMSTVPGTKTEEIIAKIYTTTQVGNVNPTVDFDDTDLLAAIYYSEHNGEAYVGFEQIVMDKEIFNQDIYVTVDTANSSTSPMTFYIELEQMKIDLNTSTFTTVKNIRSSTQA